MANTAHLVRRQSSRDLNPQRSLDRLEMKEMKGRLVSMAENGAIPTYGATNIAFEDTSPSTTRKPTISDILEEVITEKPLSVSKNDLSSTSDEEKEDSRRSSFSNSTDDIVDTKSLERNGVDGANGEFPIDKNVAKVSGSDGKGGSLPCSPLDSKYTNNNRTSEDRKPINSETLEEDSTEKTLSELKNDHDVSGIPVEEKEDSRRSSFSNPTSDIADRKSLEGNGVAGVIEEVSCDNDVTKVGGGDGEGGSPPHSPTDSKCIDTNGQSEKSTVKSAEKLPTVAEGKPTFRPECGEDDRESWDSKLTFLLATVGYAVGLGNVWRFPYLAQKNGGGAFLIPYFVMLAVEGIPMFYLELAIGQRLRKGAIGVWNQVSPYLAGIGISSAVVSFNVALYYNTIIAWCLFYFVQSFQSQLPWADCPHKYYKNGSYILEPECVQSTPTQYFWYRTTLLISESIDEPQVFNWKIAIALVVAWILVYMCMIKGIASSGKVVYVTATFPYIVLIIFFFRGVTLKGMGDGIRHLFTPKWYTLADPVVWLEAGTQIFFSLGLAFGGLIAFSSYNPVNNNCFRDAVMVSLTNCFTSMFAGIVVFSVIGFKATLNYEKCLEERNATLAAYLGHSEVDLVSYPESTSISSIPDLPVCDLEKELDNSAAGTGLAFIIFTEAINQFPGAQFWSVLFFLMLFTLGIDSQFGTLEGVVTSIVDMKLFPNLRKEILTGVMCLICCVISMCFAHGAGSYVFVLFDNFSGNFPLLIIALCECIGVSYIYGLKRFADDIELMTGTRPGLYWLICWKYLSPLAMLLILFASVAELAVDGSGYPAWIPSKGDTTQKEWPFWAILLISFLVIIAVIWIPLIAICRAFGVVIIEDNEKAWFPTADLKEFHGIVEHEVTTAETLLFCIRPDGTEGFCCPTGHRADEEEA